MYWRISNGRLDYDCGIMILCLHSSDSLFVARLFLCINPSRTPPDAICFVRIVSHRIVSRSKTDNMCQLLTFTSSQSLLPVSHQPNKPSKQQNYAIIVITNLHHITLPPITAHHPQIPPLLLRLRNLPHQPRLNPRHSNPLLALPAMPPLQFLDQPAVFVEIAHRVFTPAHLDDCAFGREVEFREEDLCWLIFVCGLRG